VEVELVAVVFVDSLEHSQEKVVEEAILKILEVAWEPCKPVAAIATLDLAVP